MWRPLRGVRLTLPKVVLASAFALLLLALILVLSGSPLVVAYANPVPPDQPIFTAPGGAGACQDGETMPAHVSAIRLIAVAVVGPRVHVTVSSNGRTLASGTTASGWTSGAVTVALAPLDHPLTGARVCFSIGPSAESVEVGGSASAPVNAARTLDGRTLPGRFTVEYMRPSSASWWSSIDTVARRLGLGHAPSGSWLAVALLLVMGAVVATAGWLTVRELG
jgi:hypothetical protein